MTTIIERDVSHDGDNASSFMATIITIVGIAAIVGIALYAFKLYPPAAADTETPVNINVTVPPAASAGF